MNIQYLSKIMKEKYLLEKNTSYQRISDLEVQEVLSGTIIPMERIEIDNTKSFYISGGVYDENMELIPLSLNKRVSPPNFYWSYDDWYSGFDKFNLKQNTKDKTIIFLGAFHPHFAHFILESMSRFWIFLNDEYLNAECVYISENEINRDYFDWIKLFGVNPSRISRLTEKTTYSKVIVPEMSLRLHDYYHPRFKSIIDKIILKVPFKPNNKVYYISRKNIGNKRIFGEKSLEYFFKILNIEYLYPETLSAEELIFKLKSCKKVVAISGTSSHNSLFMSDNSILVCLNRSPHLHPPQSMIDHMKNLKTTYVDVFLFSFLNLDWSSGPFYVYPSKYFMKFIYNDFSFKKPFNLTTIYCSLFSFFSFIFRSFKIKIALFLARKKN